MRTKKSKRLLSALMSAAVVVSGISFPAEAKSDETAVMWNEKTGTENLDKGNFNKDWKFKFGDVAGAEKKEFDDSSWDSKLLPHDFSMEQEFDAQYEAESGFLPGGTGWYRKTVVFPSDYEGKTLTLNFDGVYNHAYVYVNGTKIGENFYGYNDFSFDITDYVVCDGETENVIAVKAVNEFPSSRWYSGSGIYRDVTLVVSGDVHVADKGTYVTTPNLEEEQDGDVTVHVETTVENETEEEVAATVRTTVLDSEGNVVSKDAANGETTVAADTSTEIEQDVFVNAPELWDCENPNLYYVQTEVLVGDEVLDTYTTEFGFRYIDYTAEEGFLLNGENVKMKGVCMHHDQGALGAAAYEDAVARQIDILKGMGCNAIRTSHNTPSDVLVSLCNKKGILLQDEIFDGWKNYKNGNVNDFGKEFNKKLGADNQVLGGNADMTWSQFVLESNVNRDKNAPSVVMWSIGNELPTGCAVSCSDYPAIADNLIKWINDIDDTKPITHGDNQSAGNANDFRTIIDKKQIEAGGIVGLNYYPRNYAGVHSRYPEWPLVGTETASPANSRGIYNTLSSYSNVGDYQCTAYDTASVGWGNTARESWYYTIANDFMAGEFIWTGFDYIGEPTGTGPWNGTGTGSVVGGNQAVPNSCFFGVIDTAGFPKDSYYYYSSQWMDDRTTLHVVPQSWNEEDLVISGGKVPVHLYSNAAKVELYLNDVKVGTATRNDYTTAAGYKYATYTNASDHAELCTAVNPSREWEKMSAQFNVKYEEGTLRAKAYDENGNLIEDTYGLDYVTTNSDKGTYLKVKPEKTEIQADGTSLSYISVDVMDGSDQFVSSARNNIRFSLSGNGTIVGVDNGNPSTTDKYQQLTVLTSEKTANIDAFSGKALIIVRSTEKAGGFTLRVESAGLKGDTVTVDTVGAEEGPAYIKEYEIKKDYTIDMGNAPELQTEAAVKMSDGSSKTAVVEWNEVTEDIYNTPGDYTMRGVLKVDEEVLEIEAFLHVLPIFSGFKNYARATSAGVVPALPKTLPGILTNGEEYGAYPVVWDEIPAEELEKVDNVINVAGTIKVSEEKQYKVYATVRVAEGETMEPVNVAPQYTELTESCGQKADNLFSIVNGVKNNTSSAQERWTNWNDHLQSSSPFITFTWDETKKIDTLKMWFYTDGSVSVPEKVSIAVAEDGVDFKEVGFKATEFSPSGETTFNLDGAYNAKAVRITLTQQGNGYVGLKEVEIWTTAFGYTMNNTAVLDTLTVNGEKVTGFEAGRVNGAGYTADVEDAANAVIQAKACGNAAVTVVPADETGVAKVIVQSENQMVKNVYTIRLGKKAAKTKTVKAAAVEGELVKVPQSVMKADCTATSFKSPVEWNDGGPEFAFDGNVGSAWHTSYVEKPTPKYDELPQSIEFGLGETRKITKITLDGKTPIGNNGLIKDATVYAKSGDGEWTEVKSFTFTEAAKGTGEVVFDELVTADRIKITITDSYNRIAYKLACIGEINVWEMKTPDPVNVQVSAAWNDGNNADGDRMDIELGLKAGDAVVEGKTVTLSEENNWTAAFENLDPAFKNDYTVFCMTDGMDREKDAEGYVLQCDGTAAEGYVVTAVKSVVLNTKVCWNDNKNAEGKRPDAVSLIFKGGKSTEVANVASSKVFADTVSDSVVLPKYNADGTRCEYTVSGGIYTDAAWTVDQDVTENADGVYVVNYRLEGGEVVEADKEDLADLIEYAEGQMTDAKYEDVIPAVKNAFEAALNDAKTVMANEKATQEEVDAAYDRLLAMVQYLDFTGNNKALKELAAQAEGKREELYTKETWKVLADALAKANEVLADENALQAEIDAAAEALKAAIDGLKFIPVDKTKLQKLADKAAKYDLTQYTEATGIVLTGALAEANKVLASNEVTQADIDKAYADLQKAIFGLRFIPNKDKLEDLIKGAKAVDVAKYTAESVAAFTAALDYAEVVFADANATEEEVKAAEKALNKVQKNLVAKSDADKKGNDKVTNNDGNNNTGSKAAKTGDAGQMTVVMTMLMAAAVAVLSFRRKRR